MWSSKQAVLLCIVVCIAGIGAGCTGFFVNPTLSSLAIGPQAQTITTQQTLQMSATGTYSDGSTKDLTGKVNWSSSATACATINSNGLLSPVKTVTGICTTTISAASGTATAATTTVTVTEGTPSSIMLTASTTTPQAQQYRYLHGQGNFSEQRYAAGHYHFSDMDCFRYDKPDTHQWQRHRNPLGQLGWASNYCAGKLRRCAQQHRDVERAVSVFGYVLPG